LRRERQIRTLGMDRFLEDGLGNKFTSPHMAEGYRGTNDKPISNNQLEKRTIPNCQRERNTLRGMDRTGILERCMQI